MGRPKPLDVVNPQMYDVRTISPVIEDRDMPNMHGLMGNTPHIPNMAPPELLNTKRNLDHIVEWMKPKPAYGMDVYPGHQAAHGGGMEYQHQDPFNRLGIPGKGPAMQRLIEEMLNGQGRRMF